MSIFSLYTQTEFLKAQAEAHNAGYVKGCEQAERIAHQIAAENLRPMRELLVQRRAESPKNSPLAAVSFLVDQLERNEQIRNRLANLFWETVAQYVPDSDLEDLNRRALPVLGDRPNGNG